MIVMKVEYLTYHALNKKIFSILYLTAGVGFFGLAEVREMRGGTVVKAQRMSTGFLNSLQRIIRLRRLLILRKCSKMSGNSR